MLSAVLLIGIIAYAMAESCNPAHVLEDWVKYANERRFYEIAELADPHALFYMNGALDKGTGGRLWTVEQWQCMSKTEFWQISLDHNVARDNEDGAMAGFTITYGTADEIQSRMAWGVHIKVDRHCKMTEMRFQTGMLGTAGQKFTQNACFCFPALATQGLCPDLAPITEEELMGTGDEGPPDYSAIATQAWAAVENGDWAAAAAVFAVGSTFSYNGVDLPNPSSAAALEEAWGAFSYSDYEPLTELLQGRTLHQTLRLTMTLKGTTESRSALISARYRFDLEGRVLSFDEVLDTATSAWLAALAAEVPRVSLWTQREARQLVAPIVSNFGYPYLVTNNGDGRDFALWRPSDNRPLACFTSVRLADEGFEHRLRAFSGPYTTYIHADAPLTVPDDKLDDVRSLSGTITYDALRKHVMSRGDSVAHVMVDFHFATQLAIGAITLAEARADYPGILIAAARGPSTPVYDDLYNNLCRKLI